MRIIKVQKSKTWGIQGSHSFLLTCTPQWDRYIEVEQCLYHHTTWPSLTNPAQDPIGKHCSMEGTFIMRSSLTLSKLP